MLRRIIVVIGGLIALAKPGVCEAPASSLDTLRGIFGAQVQYQAVPVPVIRYCPDNTCEAFRATRPGTSAALADFVLLYLFVVSDYSYLGEWQRGKPPQRVEFLLQHYSASCGTATRTSLVKCTLTTLQRSAGVRLVFIRYDEGARGEVPMSLSYEMTRPK
jgi:hypothetical protein